MNPKTNWATWRELKLLSGTASFWVEMERVPNLVLEWRSRHKRARAWHRRRQYREVNNGEDEKGTFESMFVIKVLVEVNLVHNPMYKAEFCRWKQGFRRFSFLLYHIGENLVVILHTYWSSLLILIDLRTSTYILPRVWLWYYIHIDHLN